MTRARWLLVLALTAGAVSGRARAAEPQPVRVTVVVVMATPNNNKVDPKLKPLSQEVQKKHPKLTGFRIEATVEKSIPVGESRTIDLADGQTLKVTIDSPKDKTGHIGVTLAPPGLGEIQYTCVCDKFVPVITPHVTKTGEQLIVAVLAKPCTGK
jgi:hypothetical protein